MAGAIDLSPHVVVTLHTAAGDVPIVADMANPDQAGGSVSLLGYQIPYDVALIFGQPAPAQPGSLLANLDLWQSQYGPMVLLAGVVLGAWLLARRV